MREPLSVSASIDFIDEGDVQPIGNSGRYWVDGRHVSGELEGDIDGTFLMTYDANIAIATQTGPFWGSIEFHDTAEDMTYTARFHAQSGGELTSFEPGVGGTMELEIDGDLYFVDEARGHAELDAWLEVALDAEGHIAEILDSDMTIEGCWNPDDAWA